MKRALLVVVAAACGRARGPSTVAATNDLTLYRDLALVRQRVELVVPAGASSASVKVAAGVTGQQIVLVERGALKISALHVQGVAATPKPPAEEAPAEEDVDENRVAEPEIAATVAPPVVVTFDVEAPRAGTYDVVVAYTTNRLQWDADYTMTTTSARDLVVLRGAIAVRNTTGIAFDRASIHVVDAELERWRASTAEHLASDLVGGTTSTTPAATPRDLGLAHLVEGETRVEIAGISKPRTMRSVLVYDPIGTKLDNAGAAPVRDEKLGIVPAAPTRITESFEVERDEASSAGLPAGRVRLLERRGDGGLGVLGESNLFAAATRVADVDTIAVGTAEGVTARRERRELTVDDARKRITEEFVITLDNTRDHDVGVLVREHLYRSQNWTIAFESTKRPSKEGAQQFSMRSSVPAKSQQKILYVVVYTWDK